MKRNYDVLKELDKGIYQNNKVVDMGGIPFSVRDLVVKAPLLAGLNVYLVGATGEGKTQLAHDLASYFGKDYIYTMGRPSFEPSELLRKINLAKLKEAKDDKELVELTQNVEKVLFYVDELNRMPPLVQNYLFDFFDGRCENPNGGAPVRLGKSGYHIGFGTGNLGDGDYVGISDSDRALKDRMHLILKLDHPDFGTTPLDDYDILSSKKNPRATMAQGNENHTDEIIKLHQQFQEREVPSIIPLLGVYFTKGLDYLENTKKHSKKTVEVKWPNIEGIRSDTDESKIMPLSKRAVLSSIALSQALEMIAEYRNKSLEKPLEIDSVKMFLDSLKLTTPFSGVFNPAYVYNECNADNYEAFDNVLGVNSVNRINIKAKQSDLEDALFLAEAGKKDVSLLDKIANPRNSSDGKWMPIRATLAGYADRREQTPSEEGMRIRDILEKIEEDYKNKQK